MKPDNYMKGVAHELGFSWRVEENSGKISHPHIANA
jgi:hypothetical protein